MVLKNKIGNDLLEILNLVIELEENTANEIFPEESNELTRLEVDKILHSLGEIADILDLDIEF